MIVVCDTTPINYLVLIELVELIPHLYERACLPTVVLHELRHPKAPSLVRDWASDLPQWITIEDAGAVSLERVPGLQAGERQAIAIAENLKADFLLTDDAKARAYAHRRNISTVTTLLILDVAADRGLINFRLALDRLLQTNFRVDALTLEKLTRKHF